MGADEGEKRRYGRTAFEVDDIGVATTQDARLDVALAIRATRPSASASFYGVFEMEIAARIGNETAAEKRPAKIRCLAAWLFDQMLP